jgi:nucleotide-binding universal stress UspA family protein
MNSAANENTKKLVVLAGIDFQVLSKEVLAVAGERAASAGGELHVVHVIPENEVASVQGARAIGVVQLAADARARLEQLAADLPPAVKRIFLHLTTGKAAIEIAQLASDIGANLVVVGTHGRTGLDRLVSGSVAASLLRLSPCPVFVYRSHTVPAAEQIAPPCPDCLEVQRASGRTRLWCDRHSQRRGRPHTYSETPESFGLGSMTFR